MYLENGLSNLTLDKIEQELRELNFNLAEANDLATLSVFREIPPNLDNESRKSLKDLRAKYMARARKRTEA